MIQGFECENKGQKDRKVQQRWQWRQKKPGKWSEANESQIQYSSIYSHQISED